MKWTVLSDNRSSDSRLSTEHGLSILLETEQHKILLDTGASDVFMEWNSWTSPECFYLSEADVPTGISGIEAQRRLAKGRTYRMAKNGRMFVVKPDGSVFTLDGVRVL